MDYFPPINGDAGNPNRPYENFDLGAGIEGSIPHAKAIEGPMREILAVIDHAAIVRDGGVFTQLRQAILALIAAHVASDATDTVKGIVELATAAEALAGTDTTRAVTSAGLASVKSLTSNGYYKFPGGLMIQWGVKALVGYAAGVAVTFPTAFPTAALVGLASLAHDPGGPSDDHSSIYSLTTTGAVMRGNSDSSSGGSAAQHNYLVIGY
ncbi:MAG: hypothetical protein DI551_09205 [Micavibrio aeruginosavorus]|uniref:Putative tail fiber protein gp53-like C-terminal domain-containing protein n=1 Tax=Micavibrio aeruginosavorus TaxID=349221 RepID=A0A2W5MX23_9BACT|nr:MAG: hypothetical protein DI551_09205 [Micavibrio aeruginosavorus]